MGSPSMQASKSSLVAISVPLLPSSSRSTMSPSKPRMWLLHGATKSPVRPTSYRPRMRAL